MNNIFKTTPPPAVGDSEKLNGPRQPSAKRPAATLPKFNSASAVILYALKGGARSFALALALRGGVSVLMALLKVYRKKMTLMNALKLFYGPDALRFAKMVGSFSFLWKSVLNLLHFTRRTLTRTPSTQRLSPTSPIVENEASLLHDRIFSFIAGSVAGLSVVFESPANRVAVMQQLGIRSMQSFYAHLHARSLVHVPHGDSLLFALACGSLLYGYAMQPETLPKARMPVEMLEINRLNVRSLEATSRGVVDVEKFTKAIHKHGGQNAWKALTATQSFVASHDGHFPVVPCSVMHPCDESCARYTGDLFLRVMRMMAPVNATLNVVPLVLFKGGEVVKQPVTALRRTLVATLRSSVFLAAFVTTFQAGICAHREVMRRGLLTRDHKVVYYLLGVLAGWSIFLEKKSRRSELVLYCMPKALESLYMVLLNRRLLIHVPGSEILVTSLVMGNLMSLYRCESETVGGLLAKVMDRMVGKF
ncbi:hypothetical protein BC829DRAFT_362650 [Chytridium lagenaria]|nr:hypothetical protein BC829DRAFT_362650 [Chytridium lagenaria]